MPLQPFKVKAIFDYASPHEDDLSFPNGQLITVTEEEDDDWYYGEYKDANGISRSGLFPRNHVERFEVATPPRPARHSRKATEARESSTSKSEPAAEVKPDRSAEAEEPPTAVSSLEPEDKPSTSPVKEPIAPVAAATPADAVEPEEAKSPPPVGAPARTPSIPAPKDEPTPAKKAPPPVADKPTSGSFKDRIAAFNKPAAAPVAPVKPSGLGGSSGSGFVKKPFVPPPPSRNAYVPPPREKPQVAYQREEESERPAPPADAGSGRPAEPAEEEQAEDQPKPTSLKERIALLQKQQLEQAQRHADAAQKKEKPKRATKKRTDSSHDPNDVEGGAPVATPRGPPADIEDDDDSAIGVPPSRRRTESKEETPASGGRELFSDTNDADQSADPETEDNEQLSQSGMLPPKPLPRTENFGTKQESEGGSDGDEGQNNEEDEEEEMDPEIRRRMEIRARMAKMSGGMGMAGMFGPPGGLPSMPKKKSKTESESSRQPEANDVTSPPVPVMALPGMSMPGMQKIRSPSVENEPSDTGIGGAHEDDSASDEEAPVEPPVRRSTDAQSQRPDEGTKPRKSMDTHLEDQALSPKSGARPVPPPPQDRAAPPVPLESRPPPPIPPRAASTASPPPEQSSEDEAPPSPPAKDESEDKRISRPPPPLPPTRPETATSPKAPPVPSAAPPVPTPQTRAPPPPPPASPPEHHDTPEASDSEEEYEGDIDTDIAPNASHKDALTAHAKRDSTDDTLTGDEASYHHSGLPSLGLPVSRPTPPAAPPQPPQVPRTVPPPPPPSQPPRPAPSEMPRGAPPPPPVPKASTFDESIDTATTPTQEPRDEDLYNASPKRRESDRVGLASPPPASAAPPPPKRSLDAPRESFGGRRSVDAGRLSTEQGFVADDVDLGYSSQWWTQRRMPPPSLQNRNDVSYEIEDSTAIQDGQELVSKTVYVLWMDYSKTIITARFAPTHTALAELQQRQEPPPPRLRQDQLEEAHSRYGAQIADIAKSKTNTVVGNGSPFALISEIFSSLDALPPVGNRAYGALVYSNLANATVQQFDEIRAGDIISFRNAKLQGHKGAMKQKYNIEVGKPDHVGVVVDWDGTKKKVQAWEQGRESKKVKVESFKLGDLRSGEVKVWRVMPRTWVGWGR